MPGLTLLPGTTRLVFDKTQDSAVALDLLRLIPLGQGIPPKKLPESSLELVGNYVGIDPAWSQNPKLADKGSSLRDLYTLLIKAREHTGHRLFDGLTFDTAVFEKANLELFSKLLERMQTLLSLKGAGFPKAPYEAWEELKRELGFPKHLSAADVQRMHEASSELMVNNLLQHLRRRFPNITFNDFERVEASFGSLEPLFHLMGRMRNEGYSMDEDFSHIFQSLLDDRFRDMKYRGYLDPRPEYAASQLASLKTEAHRKAWEENPSRVAFHRRDESNSTDDLRETLKNTVSVQLENNLRDLPRVTSEEVEKVREILAGDTGHPQRSARLRELWKGKTELEGDARTVAAVRAHLQTLSDPLQAADFAKRFLPLAKNSRLFSFQVPPDALADFETIAGLEAASRKMQRGESVLATMVTDDPRLLLRHGCLATDSSCQDLRSGGYYFTALSPVVDAHVKLILGVSVQAQNFEWDGDYKRLAEAVNAGTPVQAQAIGRNNSVRFTWKNGSKEEQVQTRPLAHFGRRHLLKLGGVSSDPKDGSALALERAYNTSTAPTLALGKEAKALLEDVAKATGSQTGVAVHVPPSRTQNGAYSDAAGGIKKADYIIPAGRTLGDER